jgi:phage terminase large subunit-like protein
VEGENRERTIKDVIMENLKDFVEKHFVTESGKPVNLASYQEQFIRDVLEKKSRKYIMVSATRCGKTEACAVIATLVAILSDGEEISIVAPVFKQAEKMFKRIRNYFLSNKALLSLIDMNKSFRRDEITLFNNSVIRCLSAANPESLLGFGATVLIVDEAGSIPDVVYRTRVLRMTASSAAGEADIGLEEPEQEDL